MRRYEGAFIGRIILDPTGHVPGDISCKRGCVYLTASRDCEFRKLTSCSLQAGYYKANDKTLWR